MSLPSVLFFNHFGPFCSLLNKVDLTLLPKKNQILDLTFLPKINRGLTVLLEEVFELDVASFEAKDELSRS